MVIDMDSTDQVVAEAVREAIKESGKTRRAVANAIGISPRTMVRRLNESRPFQVREILGIAKFLGIKAGHVLDDVQEKLS